MLTTFARTQFKKRFLQLDALDGDGADYARKLSLLKVDAAARSFKNVLSTGRSLARDTERDTVDQVGLLRVSLCMV